MNRNGYCIFIDTICQGRVPSVTELNPVSSRNAAERICVFPTERDAQREIVDSMMIRLQQFLDGERDFDDAIAVEEYVVEVGVCPDGTIVDVDGNEFA